MEEMQVVFDFLAVRTPGSWVKWALEDLPTILIDHAHCEKKAASTALNLMFRYVDRPDLLRKMSQLAREELLHFEQVLDIMQQQKVEYQYLTAAKYAGGLRAEVRKKEPGQLIDTLICGAIIEARSCERFFTLSETLSQSSSKVKYAQELSRYYQFLLKSESRHFLDYLDLAENYAEENIQSRIDHFKMVEADLILTPSGELRFHSGPPL